MEEENNNPRSSPMSELDLAMKNTNPEWGSHEVNQELQKKLTKYYIQKDDQGNERIVEVRLWDLLHIYSRDLRLGNLSTFNNEVHVCEYMLDLSSDLIQANMPRAFLASVTRVATITEVSQSKGGFLRRLMNTLIQENRTQNIEPPKKTLFGGKKEGANY